MFNLYFLGELIKYDNIVMATSVLSHLFCDFATEEVEILLIIVTTVETKATTNCFCLFTVFRLKYLPTTIYFSLDGYFGYSFLWFVVYSSEEVHGIDFWVIVEKYSARSGMWSP